MATDEELYTAYKRFKDIMNKTRPAVNKVSGILSKLSRWVYVYLRITR